MRAGIMKLVLLWRLFFVTFSIFLVTLSFYLLFFVDLGPSPYYLLHPVVHNNFSSSHTQVTKERAASVHPSSAVLPSVFFMNSRLPLSLNSDSAPSQHYSRRKRARSSSEISNDPTVSSHFQEVLSSSVVSSSVISSASTDTIVVSRGEQIHSSPDSSFTESKQVNSPLQSSPDPPTPLEVAPSFPPVIVEPFLPPSLPVNRSRKFFLPWENVIENTSQFPDIVPNESKSTPFPKFPVNVSLSLEWQRAFLDEYFMELCFDSSLFPAFSFAVAEFSVLGGGFPPSPSQGIFENRRAGLQCLLNYSTPTFRTSPVLDHAEKAQIKIFDSFGALHSTDSPWSRIVLDHWIDSSHTFSLNQPPRIVSLSQASSLVGDAYISFIEVEDDSKNLFYDLVSGPPGMSLDPQNGNLVWPNTIRGIHEVVVSVDDGEFRILQQFYVHGDSPSVQNRAPTLSQPPDVNVNEGQAVTVILSATDPDGDSLSFTLNDTRFVSSGNVFRLVTSFFDAGVYTVRASVSDGKHSESKLFRVTVNNVNRKPIFATTPPLSATVGVPYRYEAAAIDPDNDTLVFTFGKSVSGMLIDTVRGIVDWIPTPEQVGTYELTLQVSDGITMENQSFFLTVSDSANSPPRVSSTPVTSGSALVPYFYDVDSVDDDGDHVVYSLVSSPVGMTIDSNGLIGWTPASTQGGNHLVVVSVSDGKATVFHQFSITVNGGACVENWVCTNFGDCINGVQKRVCRDVNNCSTQVARPSESQNCFSDCSQQENGCQNFCDGPDYYSKGLCVNGRCSYGNLTERSLECYKTVPVNFYRGLNLISQPLRDSQFSQASKVVEVTHSPFVARLRGGKFEAYIPGLTPDFNISGGGGKGYLISVPQNVTFTRHGLPYRSVSYTIGRGLNIISLPFRSTGFYNSDDVARVFGASWIVRVSYDPAKDQNVFQFRHPQSGIGSVFMVNSSESYIIYARRSFTMVLSNTEFENQMKTVPYPTYEAPNFKELEELQSYGIDFS